MTLLIATTCGHHQQATRPQVPFRSAFSSSSQRTPLVHFHVVFVVDEDDKLRRNISPLSTQTDTYGTDSSVLIPAGLNPAPRAALKVLGSLRGPSECVSLRFVMSSLLLEP